MDTTILLWGLAREVDSDTNACGIPCCIRRRRKVKCRFPFHNPAHRIPRRQQETLAIVPVARAAR